MAGSTDRWLVPVICIGVSSGVRRGGWRPRRRRPRARRRAGGAAPTGRAARWACG
ncbi:hypothetical protein [Ornithinimicrobium kibberense]|uniref:hypothetical protein n=1 Tax=Ornithinimicrobium kibberense TaxID=282060 RepID=UPI00361C3157